MCDSIHKESIIILLNKKDLSSSKYVLQNINFYNSPSSVFRNLLIWYM